MAAIAAAALALTAGWCSPAEGESGTVHRTIGYGLEVTVDTRWVDGFGYRPVRITVSPTAATAADRTLTVEFLVRRQWTRGNGYDLRVVQEIEIPAGSGPVHATLSVPQHVPWNSYAIDVREDGVRLDSPQASLCTPWTSIANTAAGFGECLPVVLVVGDSLPDTSKLAAPLPLDAYYDYQPMARPPASSGQPSRPLPTAASCPLAELPQRWLDYSSLDVLCLSLGQLAQLKQKHPATLQAILEWTAAGGNLWVHGVGQDWQRIGQLEELVGLPPGVDDTRDPPERGWTEPAEGLYRRPVRAAMSESYPEEYAVEVGDYGVVRPPAPAVRVTPPDARPGAPARRPHFVLRPYELGLIVAFAEDPFPGQRPAEWNWVWNAMGTDRWLWFQRHGMSMLRENPDYWKFLIPGVGLAPVTEFCVLITLFVLAIGPLNYWLLRRWKRLHLLVVTIPLSATTVTLLLFAYALVADGLGTRVRVRSVTHLDQGRGQAACWARLSYYAGLAPGRGLVFPADVAVLPLEHTPVNDYYPPRPALRRQLIWEDDQWLASGWLSSRTPTQYLTVRSRPSDLGLDLVRSGKDPEKLEVKNRLGTQIKQLLVCSGKNEYYWASDVGVDATATLEPVKLSVAQGRLSRAPQLTLPEGMTRQYYGGVFGVSRRRRGWGWGNAQSSIATPNQRTGRLERSLAGMGALAGGNFPLLESGGYVAVVQRSPEVQLGVSSAREEDSYHVILGEW